ncbi:hypothetical protein SAMD00019534_032630 [Acytostelium subglobosum LB1]|uniref:hypothetical protein n=1 Tax=Acytostelium subglobosum LB1 TaxID=1410327 RepID=UPI000644E7AB|nr:hypothetical protein SAMD00019534_032630 [Acytostelium subglobosum LB1]GAM20088.1 hypothetical protein SAMD00019534_032630 [Acytostelium subglobosum LB1]|eukprot:XP_012756850.1 hypothetical protein SAMD00019534_032630 [Acytostelium subglobosum LB1]
MGGEMLDIDTFIFDMQKDIARMTKELEVANDSCVASEARVHLDGATPSSTSTSSSRPRFGSVKGLDSSLPFLEQAIGDGADTNSNNNNVLLEFLSQLNEGSNSIRLKTKSALAQNNFNQWAVSGNNVSTVNPSQQQNTTNSGLNGINPELYNTVSAMYGNDVVNVFAEWRALIDEEITEIYTLVKDLKKQCCNTWNSRPSSASDTIYPPYLASRIKCPELYMHNNTFTNILQLKNDIEPTKPHPNQSQQPIIHLPTPPLSKACSHPDLSAHMSNGSLSKAYSQPDLPGILGLKGSSSGGGVSANIIPTASTSKMGLESASSSTCQSKSTTPVSLSPADSPVNARRSSPERRQLRMTVETPDTKPSIIINKANGRAKLDLSPTKVTTNIFDIKPLSVLGPKSTPPRSSSCSSIISSSNSSQSSNSRGLSLKNPEEMEGVVRTWIQKVLKCELKDLGSHLPNASPLGHHLRSGVILCQLINALTEPNRIRKINHTPIAFQQIENIDNFLKAATALGVDKRETFFSTDLSNLSNMNMVMSTIYSLARATNHLDELRTIAAATSGVTPSSMNLITVLQQAATAGQQPQA